MKPTSHKLKKALILLAPLPSFFYLLLFFSHWSNLDFLNTRVLEQKADVNNWNKQRKQEQLYTSELQQADPDYLENSLKQVSLIGNSNKKLSFQIVPQFLSSDSSHVEQAQNQCEWDLITNRVKGDLEETEVKLQYPITCDQENLMQLLAVIEGETIGAYSPLPGRPDLQIKSFSLKRELSPTKKQSYQIDLELIKRELKHKK